MPRLPIDYTKAVIYKIVCRDVSVTETYVGSTTDLRKRKACHKHDCNSPNCKQYHLFVYRFIRENGGFENWEIVLIEKAVDCSDSPSLRARERYWMEYLQAGLNKQIPARTKSEWNEDNRDKIRENGKNYYKLNRDNRKECVKKYNELNRDKIIEYQSKYKILNKAKINEKHKEYYKQNRDKFIERAKKYNELNRDKINEKKRERRALKKATVLN
jgi:hypothetical protein